MELRDVVLIVITPLALILGALAGSFRNRLDRRTDLGLQAPTTRHAIVFTVVFLALVVINELLNWWLLPHAKGSDWRAKYDGAALIMRVVFGAVVYPVAEELFFRGFLLALLKRKAGVIAAVVLTSVLFTLLHSLQGPWLGALQIFTDGLFFAYVRVRSGSVYLPMAFHIIGNSIAVLQRVW
jgi:membrane protease YdiL (CAAX protease family)